MKKRCFSFILALCMVCTLLPVSAIAVGASLDNFQKTLTYTPGQYADVPATNTFSENVKAAYEYNIMQGYGTTFGVTSNITRLASIIIACRLNCIYNTGVNNITELYTGTTQEIHLQYAKDHGIFCDFDDVSKSATRAEFAAILSSALPDAALPGINDIEDNEIPDVKSDTNYSADIYRLYRAGIVNGSDKYGTFYPASNITRGAACAIATRMCDVNLRKNVVLEVKPVPVESLQISKSELELNVGESATLNVTILPENATDQIVTWSSADPAVASVVNGKITANAQGNTVITAKCGDKTITCNVTVKVILATSVILGTKSVSLETGSSMRVTATVLPENATDKSISWNSSNKSVAVVSSNGVITAVSAGTATITAICDNGFATCTVTVTDPPPIRLIIKNSIPCTVYDRSYGKIGSSLTISDVSFEIRSQYADTYRITVTYSGTLNKPTVTGAAHFRYKLTDVDGYVVESDLGISPRGSAGDRFRNGKLEILENLSPGTYYLEFYDDTN